MHAQLLSCVWLFTTLWTQTGSSLHGVLQARILEWVAISFPCVSCIGRQILYHQTTGNPSLCLERGNSESKKTSKEVIFQARDDGALNQGGGDKNCLGWGYILKIVLIEFVDGLAVGYKRRVEVGSYCSLEPEQLDQRFCHSLKWLILREELILVGTRVRGSVSDTLSFRCLLDTLFE